MRRKVNKTKHYSWKIGKLAKGCEECVKGNKLVLFTHGFCTKNCFYCPISEKKWHKDFTYANEWKIDSPQDIIKEAELCNAKGAGITGGDPLIKIERTIKYIKLLKKRFGKKFHIHLYAPLNIVDKERLAKLHKAGLDEIRFHPDLHEHESWFRIEFARKYNWKIGVEIPVIPGMKKEIIHLIEYIKNKVDFLNLNELEISDTNVNQLVKRGFIPKNRSSYGVLGSEELAHEILDYCIKHTKLNVHYCTCTLKDKVQMANRIKKRAKNIAKEYDMISDSGTLIRGAIYIPEFLPSFSYREKVEEIGKDKKQENYKNRIINKLKKIRENLIKNYNIPKNLIEIDTKKLRILTNTTVVERLKEKIKKQGFKPAIVEEYPTWDGFEVEIEFL